MVSIDIHYQYWYIRLSHSWKPIIDHIDSKYDEYLNAESRVTRGAQLDDHRIHCCLYFITPSGHGLVVMKCHCMCDGLACSLKQLDVAFMKQLHEKVNIVPVIAKADTFTPEECERFKSTVCIVFISTVVTIVM